MRNALTAAIMSLVAAFVLVGSASADTYYGDLPQVNNLALQNQLERDATGHRLHRAPLGVVIYPGDQTPSAATTPSNADTGADQPAHATSNHGRRLRSARFSG